MKTVFLALAAITLLAGCDAAKEAMNQVVKEQQPMTLVFQSGYKMLVGGKPAPVFGTDECPKADKFMKAIFGPEPDEGQRACVVIAPDTSSIDVLVGFADGPKRETWTVERDGDRTMLRRADGSYLTEAK
ncbi:TPA: hypothetical protein ACNU8V_006424 [Pseudomonas aeruginosa]